MSSVGSELLNEIERVAAKRERWKQYALGAPRAQFRPGIALMTIAIGNAKKAILEDDAVTSVAALQALRDFNEDD